ncbi:MAG: hypothetical protein V7746_09040 [Halioglobus sp.]
MNTSIRIFAAVLTATVISGCELKDEDPEGVIPQGYKDAVNKAENVEGLLQDAQKTQLEDIDANTE